MKKESPSLIKLKKTEDGFVIPIALGFGLIALMLATTAIVRSQDGRVIAINQKASASSLSAAEAGVAQIQNFLNNNRAAAAYPACVTWATSGTPLCSDTATTQSWGNASTISNLCSTTTTTSMADNTWKSVDSSNPSRGEYKLENYSSAGLLTIQGRANTGQSSEAISSLQVSFPITTVAQEQAASLWVKTSVSGSPQIDSDVVGPCVGTMSATAPTGSNYLNFRTGATMPSAPTKPTTSIKALTSLSGKTLPESGDSMYDPTPSDTTNGDAVYQYSVPQIASGDHFRITAGNKVAIWVANSINLTDTIITNQCGTSTTCGPFDVSIYGELSTGGTLTLNQGSVVCDVFFHLPNYNVTLNTGGTTPLISGTTPNCSTSTTKNTSIYWVNSWSSSVSGTTIINPSRDIWGSSPVSNFPIPPRIGPATRWDPQSS